MMTIRRQRRASRAEWNELVERARRTGHESAAHALESGATIIVRGGEEVLPPVDLVTDASPVGATALEMMERASTEPGVNARGSGALS